MRPAVDGAIAGAVSVLVFALPIGACIPDRAVGLFKLRGLVRFGLSVAGVASACGVARLTKRLRLRNSHQPLMLALSPYRWPAPRALAPGAVAARASSR